MKKLIFTLAVGMLSAQCTKKETGTETNNILSDDTISQAEPTMPDASAVKQDSTANTTDTLR